MANGETSNKMSGTGTENISVVDNFRMATSSLLERFLKYFKFEKFSKKYYPEIYENDPELLHDVYNQFLPQIKNSIHEDIITLCEDQQIYTKLEELNKLAEDASHSSNVKAWRPSGNPNEDIRDHRCKYKLSYKKNLESLLKNLRLQNENSDKEIMIVHEEIMMLKEKVTKQDEENQSDFSNLEKVDFNMIENIEEMIEDS